MPSVEGLMAVALGLVIILLIVTLARGLFKLAIYVLVAALLVVAIRYLVDTAFLIPLAATRPVVARPREPPAAPTGPPRFAVLSVAAGTRGLQATANGSGNGCRPPPFSSDPSRSR